ncbi:DUF7309 domain-containing protein [Paraliobacillus sediminis]|uniref:DUF7309 domain-containing protein n=1 Tax=Paraliobacillus sediminis TaxID=1885916 RepID=UPI000E3EC5A1|nr:hypothetical protein [Paraliobacillus sediminis]
MIHELIISKVQKKVEVEDSYFYVLVDAHTTFASLHEIFQGQIASKIRAHWFETIILDTYSRVVDESLNNNRDEISTSLMDLYKEGITAFSYVYLTDEYHRLIIDLNNILLVDQTKRYPICHHVINLKKDPTSAHSKQKITPAINSKLSPFQQPALVQDTEITVADYNQLFPLLKLYHQLEPWRILKIKQFIAIWTPQINNYSYFSMIGTDAGLVDFACYPGAEGLNTLLTVLSQSSNGQEPHLDQRVIEIHFSEKNQIPHFYQQAVHHLQSIYPNQVDWPVIESVRPGHAYGIIDKEEFKIIQQVLPQLIDTITRAIDSPTLIPITADKWFARKVDSDGNYYDSHLNIVKKFRENNHHKKEKLLVPEITLQRIKHNFKQLYYSVEIGCIILPNILLHTDNHQPYYPHIIIGATLNQEEFILKQSIEPTHFSKQVQAALLDMINDIACIPSEIKVETAQLERALQPLCASLSISLSLSEDIPILTSKIKQWIAEIESEDLVE